MKFKILFGLLIIGSILSYGGFLYLKQLEKEKSEQAVIQKRKDYELLVEASKKIKKIWEEGEASLLKKYSFHQCPGLQFKLDEVGSSYFQCNSHFLNCFMQVKRNEGLFTVFDKNKKVKVYPQVQNNGKWTEVITRSTHKGWKTPNFGVKVGLSLKGRERSLDLILEDTCKEVYLPQRKFGYGQWIRRKKDWNWDNFSSHILIDKFQVTFRDILEWQEAGGDKSIQIPENDYQLAFPAERMTWSQMKNYCAFKGKQVLSAHVYDAATFHPGNYENKRPVHLVRGPYPWTVRSRESFIYKARVNNNYEITAKDCKKAYISGCEKILPFKPYATTSSTWSGMFQVLGGYLEAMRNPINPNQNVKASSFYQGRDSMWNRLGKRIRWDGEGFGEKNLYWGEDYELGKGDDNFLHSRKENYYKIGFRCMRFIANEN